ncbi:hypothetical protein BKA70DRAFT_207398 [Coprinopsis sp. MPI-PUGE-AT-0042]|nr:hypothetical protein BKA70DRAFT_207398 [Coprinopsis sp. MPI-PUGE-AT-0042]
MHSSAMFSSSISVKDILKSLAGYTIPLAIEGPSLRWGSMERPSRYRQDLVACWGILQGLSKNNDLKDHATVPISVANPDSCCTYTRLSGPARRAACQTWPKPLSPSSQGICKPRATFLHLPHPPSPDSTERQGDTGPCHFSQSQRTVVTLRESIESFLTIFYECHLPSYLYSRKGGQDSTYISLRTSSQAWSDWMQHIAKDFQADGPRVQHRRTVVPPAGQPICTRQATIRSRCWMPCIPGPTWLFHRPGLLDVETRQPPHLVGFFYAMPPLFARGARRRGLTTAFPFANQPRLCRLGW